MRHSQGHVPWQQQSEFPHSAAAHTRLAACVPSEGNMARPATTHSPSMQPTVLLTGSVSREPVLDLLGCSRWTVRQAESLDAAAAPIEDGTVPLVICGPCDWRELVEASRNTLHPPAIVVLTGEPDDAEWMEVLNAGAHYVDARNLAGARLFSLLNLLWRGWNGGL